jgi:glyoxylase-like metal-dependent hydrolase (beta-lactamase superfamily II)
VYAWVQPGGVAGVANAGVVADADGLTVVDTLMVRSQWEPFAAAVAALGPPVRRVVLTNGHVDHVGGTRAFPMSAVYGSRRTSDALDLALPIDAYQRFWPEFAEEFDDLATVGTRPATHLVDGAAQLTPRVEVLPAAGYTPGDVMVLVADAEVCFTGGLGAFGARPLGWESDFTTWIATLDVVVQLADVLVPGVGAVGGEAEARALQDYLRACVAAHGDVGALADGPWRDWPDPRCNAINVERAALLAAGRDELPPSMLRILSGGGPPLPSK